MQKKTHRNKVRRPNKACSVVLEKQIGPVNRLSILQMVSAEPPAAARKKKTAANHLAAKCPYVCCNMALEGSLQDLAANRHNERACRKEAAKTTFGVALKKNTVVNVFFRLLPWETIEDAVCMDAATKTAAHGQFDRQGTVVEHGRSVGSTRSKYSVGAWFGAALESGLANKVSQTTRE